MTWPLARPRPALPEIDFAQAIDLRRHGRCTAPSLASWVVGLADVEPVEGVRVVTLIEAGTIPSVTLPPFVEGTFSSLTDHSLTIGVENGDLWGECVPVFERPTAAPTITRALCQQVDAPTHLIVDADIPLRVSGTAPYGLSIHGDASPTITGLVSRSADGKRLTFSLSAGLTIDDDVELRAASATVASIYGPPLADLGAGALPITYQDLEDLAGLTLCLLAEHTTASAGNVVSISDSSPTESTATPTGTVGYTASTGTGEGPAWTFAGASYLSAAVTGIGYTTNLDTQAPFMVLALGEQTTAVDYGTEWGADDADGNGVNLHIRTNATRNEIDVAGANPTIAVDAGNVTTDWQISATYRRNVDGNRTHDKIGGSVNGRTATEDSLVETAPMSGIYYPTAAVTIPLVIGARKRGGSVDLYLTGKVKCLLAFNYYDATKLAAIVRLIATHYPVTLSPAPP